jgi:hypothetical protein
MAQGKTRHPRSFAGRDPFFEDLHRVLPLEELMRIANEAAGYSYVRIPQLVPLYKKKFAGHRLVNSCMSFMQFMPLVRRRKSARYYRLLRKLKNNIQWAYLLKEYLLPWLEHKGCLVVGLGSFSIHNILVVGEDRCIHKWSRLIAIREEDQEELDGCDQMHDMPIGRRSGLVSFPKSAMEFLSDPKVRARLLQLFEGYRPGQDVVLYDDSIATGASHAIVAIALNRLLEIPFEKIHCLAAISEQVPNNKRKKKKCK